MHYLAERGRSALQGVGINRGEHQIMGNAVAPPLLGGEAWLTTWKQDPSPYLLSHQIWSFCIKGCVHK